MNGVETLRSAFNAAHFWFDGTVADVTHDQANYLPEGRAHPIAELIAHVVQSEDNIINGMLQQKPTIWETGDWSAKLGMPNVARQTTETARAFKGDPATLNPYKDEVYAAVNAYFDSITDADLDREIDLSAMGMGTRRVGDILVMLPLGNTFAHTGEISALKGVQGAQGYPF